MVVITGASSGIGAATAEAFAREKARLVLGARRVDRLQAVAEHCRRLGAEEVFIRRVDVAQRADARAFVSAALGHFERIDVLVNNAGAGLSGNLIAQDEAEIRQVIDTNLLGAVWTSQAALPAMISARQGVIVNVASVVGFRAMPYSAVYSASKHGLVGLSHALRGELSGTGVKVATVYPATTRTEFFDRSGGRMGAMVYPPAWVARSIVWAARWPRRDVVVVPYRLLWWAEPFLGGFIDHLLGEFRRKNDTAAV